MSRAIRIFAVAAFVAAAASGVPGAGVPPASAASACDGVWVVVDASVLGGSATVSCAPGDPSSGLAALTGAGHEYSFVPSQPGLVCIIDGRPASCNGAPTDAYWSYWHAEAGGSWTYSQRGAGARDPQPGSVDGWAFGAGSPPSVAPPAPPPDPKPRSDPKPPPEPKPQPGSKDEPEPRSSAAASAGTQDGSGGGGGSGSTASDADVGVSGDEPTGDAPEPDPSTAPARRRQTLEPGDPRLPRLTVDRAPAAGGQPAAPPTEPAVASLERNDGEVAAPGPHEGTGLVRPAVGVLLIGAVAGGAVLQRRRRLRAGAGS